MNDVENLTLQVLEDIRSELRSIKDEVGKTNERLGKTNAWLDKTNDRLDRLEQRQMATEIHLASELTSVIGAIRDLKDTLVAEFAVKKVADDHELRLALLEQRSRH